MYTCIFYYNPKVCNSKDTIRTMAGPPNEYGAKVLLSRCTWEVDCSRCSDDGFVSLAWSGRFFFFWVAPFSSYLAKSCLKLGLPFFLLFLEFFPELPEGPVRPVSRPVRLVCTDLTSFYSCPPSVEFFDEASRDFFICSNLGSPMTIFFSIVDSSWFGRIRTLGFCNSTVYTGKGLLSIYIYKKKLGRVGKDRPTGII